MVGRKEIQSWSLGKSKINDLEAVNKTVRSMPGPPLGPMVSGT